MRQPLLRTLIAATVALAPLTAAAQTKILFNSFIQPQHPANVRIFKPWAEEITKATNGRVTFEIPTTSLAAPPQQLDGVKKGIMDMAYQFHGFLDQVKLAQVSHLPFINTSARGSSIALWRTHEKYFAKADEYKDVKLIGLFTGLTGPIYGMKKPINSTADLKGVKAYGLPGVAASLLEGAGAGVVAAPAVRSHEIISGGTVDVFAGYSVMDAGAFNTIQYAKHITDIPGGLTLPSFAMFMNRKKWDSLPQADRDIIEKLSGEALAARFAVYDELDTKVRADATAKGITISNASPAFVEEMRKLAAPMEAAWIAEANKLGVDGKAALEFYRQEAQKNAR